MPEATFGSGSFARLLDNRPDVVSILLEEGDHSDPRGECPQKIN